MNPTGWVIGLQYWLRLAVSGADFPNLWPTPELETPAFTGQGLSRAGVDRATDR